MGDGPHVTRYDIARFLLGKPLAERMNYGPSRRVAADWPIALVTICTYSASSRMLPCYIDAAERPENTLFPFLRRRGYQARQNAL